MVKMDLHTHTRYSDGKGTIREAIQVAKEKGLNYLAITDHFTTTWKRHVINTIKPQNFDQYWSEIRSERETAQFNCLIGIEIDAGSRWHDIRTIFTDRYEFEIVLFEYVKSMEKLEKIAYLIQELEIKPVIGLAHNSYFKKADIEAFSHLLVEHQIFFELNSSYLSARSKKTINKLLLMKELGVQFTIGSDSHHPSTIGDTDLSVLILEKIDGLDNLIDLCNSIFR